MHLSKRSTCTVDLEKTQCVKIWTNNNKKMGSLLCAPKNRLFAAFSRRYFSASLTASSFHFHLLIYQIVWLMRYLAKKTLKSEPFSCSQHKSRSDNDSGSNYIIIIIMLELLRAIVFTCSIYFVSNEYYLPFV